MEISTQKPQVKPKVIIADDDILVLQSIHDTLEDSCEILISTDPLEILEIVKIKTVDILISDYMMPKISGITLIKEVKKINPNIISIIVTGYANKEIALEALKNGAYDFIEKPIFPEILIASVQRAWENIKSSNEKKLLLEEIKNYNQKLEVINQDLKLKNEKLQIAQNNLKIQYDALEEAQAEVQRSAMKAGMAEVAINILHNVGNILNSINVSTNILGENINKGKLQVLFNTIDLISSHQDNLPDFFNKNNKGHLIPSLLIELKKSLQEDTQSSLQELNRLAKNIDHIKTIITLQQSFASQPQFKEECSVDSLIDDALTLLEGELWVSGVNLIFNRNNKGTLVISKHKMLQVLINLIRNAKEAVLEAGHPKKEITITIEEKPTRFIIQDNGIGIAEENLKKIFTHGFTTKKLGHGFGLHSCAIAVTELGGKISVESDGANKGARFIITF